MKIIWNKVTWYSKLLAVIVLAGAIWLGFYFKNEFKKVADIKPAVITQANAKVDTSNWKTYRNEKYGYEVQYPTDPYFNIYSGIDATKGEGILLPVKINSERVFISSSPESSILGGEPGYVEVEVLDTYYPDLSILANQIKDHWGAPQYTDIIHDVFIDTEKAYLIHIGEAGELSKSDTWILNHNQKTYKITESFQKWGQEIVSRFKFTK